jgi:hypothetical protein
MEEKMPEEEKTSRFSSGLNIIQRLDQLWKNCHNFKRNGRYYQWNEELDSVWLELARDLTPEEYYDLDRDKNIIHNPERDKEKIVTHGFKSKFDNFEIKLKTLLPFIEKEGRGFEKPTREEMNKRDKQYKVLMEKQLFLARLENEIGKGTSWEEEDDDF